MAITSKWLKDFISLPAGFAGMTAEEAARYSQQSAATQQIAAQAANQAYHPAVQAQGYAPQMAQQQYKPKPSYLQEFHHPLGRKIEKAITQTIDALPYRVAERVEVIRFGPQGVVDPQFEVVFRGDANNTVLFDNVDSFPTEADIARICLMCP